MNKKGIELSVNFLVIVIISIVMLSTGILIIKKYFGTAEEIKTQIDQQTIEQIEDLLNEGELVAMPLNKKIISAGDTAIFGLGIMNVNENPTTFSIVIKFGKLVEKDKTVLNPADIIDFDPNSWILFDASARLGFRETEKIPIRVSVPEGVIPGTYIYDVEVIANNNRYGLTKMYVVVP